MTRPAANDRLNLLLVDDDPISVALLEQQLSASGHRVHTAADAACAMSLLDREEIQIVIADWVMPGVSGLDLCQWVRARRLPHFLFFIMLTAHSDRERLVEAFEHGVDDFLSKPLQTGELLARLRAWTRLVRLQRELSEQHTAANRLNLELAVANAKLAEMAVHDELTGLPNRRAAMRRLDDAWGAFVRNGTPLAAAMVDVDGFKGINDTFGHAAGDQALRDIAQTLTSCVRHGDEVFRYGGDEFLLLFPGGTAADAAACTDRCRALVTGVAVRACGSNIPCSISAGIAVASAQTQSAVKLIHAADSALYAAKASGKGTFRTHEAVRYRVRPA